MKKLKEEGLLNRPCEMENLYHDNFMNLHEMEEVVITKPTLLLHSCCGPCSSAVIERLDESYEITVYFYNPNITEREEYEKRKDTQLALISQYNGNKDSKNRIAFLEGHYDLDQFYEISKGLEKEPEGGKRCACCFQLRLEKTAETASILGFDCFATTLTVSPHKHFETISKIGVKLGVKYGLSFLNEDFKKKDGYKRSIELSKQYNLYRQNDCGCRFARGGEEK